ncbi:hypothetical protein LJR034_005292 [Caballeronia sp. LjRoot34]|uniref:hypothetical protein n=1 Tax=Caballeronia sp. LjRoot34 TaxID=3342325 RepID=UPI003ED07DAE
MKLFDQFSTEGFHSTIATTYCVDFDAFETIALARLRGAGCTNNILVVDAGMLAMALESGLHPPTHAGRKYLVAPVSSNGVFHSKVILQLGRTKGRLFITSSNMTAAGLAGNLEVVGVVECSAEPSGEQDLIRSAWEYLLGILDRSDTKPDYQLRWAAVRSPWIATPDDRDPHPTMSDGTVAGLFASGDTRSIIRRFTDMVEGPVSRLVVVSPYWDPRLEALHTLKRTIEPKKIQLIVDTNAGLFPTKAVSRIKNARLFNSSVLTRGSARRFAHAKVFIAQTKKFDHVLFGSSNCSLAALGTLNKKQVNDEAVLYRRLPKGSAVEALFLDDVLDATGAIVDPDELAPYAPPQDKAKANALVTAGVFELSQTRLRWQPKKDFVATDDTTFEILNALSTTIWRGQMSLAHKGEAKREILLDDDAASKAVFGRVLAEDGTRSALSLITVVNALREEIREGGGRSRDKYAADLDGRTEEGLWLMKLLDDLHALDLKTHSVPDEGKGLAKRSGRQSKAQPVVVGKLSYRNFVEKQSLRTKTKSFSSVAGDHISLGRAFLNRLLGIETSAIPDEAEDEDSDLFPMGDETDQPGNALEQGQEFTGAAKKVKKTSGEDKTRINKARREKRTRDQILAVGFEFAHQIREKGRQQIPLTGADILKLRAYLTIVAASSYSGRVDDDTSRAEFQVFSNVEEVGWPKAMGSVLTVFFGGATPAVHQLVLSDDHDGMPEDVIECWATAMWCIHAACARACGLEKNSLQNLRRKMLCNLGVFGGNFDYDTARKVSTSLTDRFGVRLGVALEDILFDNEGAQTPQAEAAL